jgi:hypothetical protein
MPFDQDTLALLDETIELDILTPRRDGSISSRPIWIVVVDDVPYVRSYRGESGAWFRRVRADGTATLQAGERSIDVVAELIARDADLDERISDAFRAKYGARSPGPTAGMLTPEVTATTMRLG